MNGEETTMSNTVLYASVGADLVQFDIDVSLATLTRRGTVSVPANVQYAWPHASRRFLYAASSDSASGMGPSGSRHHVSAFRIDPGTGALTPHGAPIPLPHRPIHMSTDIPSEHVLVAFNNPPGVGIYRINPDATPGAEITQPAGTDPGIFPHQVLAMPDNRHVILVARGHDAAGDRPEQPGSLRVFRFDNGVLRDEVSIAPNGGYGFGPRHLDFHPSKPWIYVSLERQNAVAMFTHDAGTLAATPSFQETTLMEPNNIRGRQAVGTVHVHPNGRFVYVANRASGTIETNGKKVFAGGQNSIAVFAVDQVSGKPLPIQHVDTHGIHCRTFHIDPSGRLMVCAHITGLPLADGTEIPPRLTLFRIGDDGGLTFARSYDIDTGGRLMWWMGMVTF
jgi:6-phosphogluconolactonase (cycloisomerase 2 family)